MAPILNMINLVATLICLIGASQLPSIFATHPATRLPIFGYLPEYRYNNFDYENAFRLGLTHLILFSLEVFC